MDPPGPRPSRPAIPRLVDELLRELTAQRPVLPPTPGPWELHQEVEGYHSVRVCVPDPTLERGCRSVAEAEIIGLPRAEAEANARLIAAAPALVGALHAFCDAYHRIVALQGAAATDPVLSAAYRDAQATLTRAVGQPPLEAVTEPAIGLCGVPADGSTPVIYCTRPRGHEGPHIAAIGPYDSPTTPVLKEWE